MSDRRTKSPFEFRDSVPETTDAGTRAVIIANGVSSKRRLFAIYARELPLPNYFGWNWDAFDECLGSLEWLRDISVVSIVHRDLPFAAGSRDRRTYIELLGDAVITHRHGSLQIQVVFPTAAAAEVHRLSGL